MFLPCPRCSRLLVATDITADPRAMPTSCLLATTFRERNDVHTPWAGAGHYAIYMKQAVQPMYECRNDMAIFADLGARLGINDYDDRTEEQWLRELTKGAVGDFETFRENGVARFAAPKDAVAFAAQIRDPDNHRFTTPSGKIEIYSMAMAARPDPYGLGTMPPIPTWFEPVEPDAKYPLMLCSLKSRQDAFDPRQPAAAGASRSGRCVDEPGRRAGARYHGWADGAHLQ